MKKEELRATTSKEKENAKSLRTSKWDIEIQQRKTAEAKCKEPPNRQMKLEA